MPRLRLREPCKVRPQRWNRGRDGTVRRSLQGAVCLACAANTVFGDQRNQFRDITANDCESEHIKGHLLLFSEVSLDWARGE